MLMSELEARGPVLAEPIAVAPQPAQRRLQRLRLAGIEAGKSHRLVALGDRQDALGETPAGRRDVEQDGACIA